MNVGVQRRRRAISVDHLLHPARPRFTSARAIEKISVAPLKENFLKGSKWQARDKWWQLLGMRPVMCPPLHGVDPQILSSALFLSCVHDRHCRLARDALTAAPRNDGVKLSRLEAAHSYPMYCSRIILPT
jgi:hypothetical protein